MRRDFYAIDRGIFDHWIARSPKRFKAWQWLIAQAAFKPKGARGSWGVVHLERGELVGSIRHLARLWRWPKSNVARFLERLREDDMILTRSGTPTGTPTRTGLQHMMTVIAICNYERFQTQAISAKARAGQQAGHRPGPQASQPVLLPEVFSPLTIQPLNQQNNRIGPSEIGSCPQHGMRSRKHGTIYIAHGTAEWRAYADDYRIVIGAEPLPDRYGGFWFYWHGEAARPPHQRKWRKSG